MAFPVRKEGKTENWRNMQRKSPKEEEKAALWPQVWASTYLRGSGHRSPTHTGASTLVPALLGREDAQNADHKP